MRDTSKESFPDNASISDLESELQTELSVLGSPFDQSTGIKQRYNQDCFSLFSCYFYLDITGLLFKLAS